MAAPAAHHTWTLVVSHSVLRPSCTGPLGTPATHHNRVASDPGRTGQASYYPKSHGVGGALHRSLPVRGAEEQRLRGPSHLHSLSALRRSEMGARELLGSTGCTQNPAPGALCLWEPHLGPHLQDVVPAALSMATLGTATGAHLHIGVGIRRQGSCRENPPRLHSKSLLSGRLRIKDDRETQEGRWNIPEH